MTTADKIGLLPGFGWIAGHGFVVTVLICWLITPGLMYVIGYVGESRLLPWTHDRQFLSFMPGDFFLGLMVAGLLVLSRHLPSERHVYNAWWFHLLVLIVTLVVAVVITRGEYRDPNGYGQRAVLSPTKLYHNIVLYGGYGYLIIVTLVAVLYWLVANLSWPVLGIVLLCLFPGFIWAGFLVIEQRVSVETSQQRVREAHINNWSPLWSRS